MFISWYTSVRSSTDKFDIFNRAKEVSAKIIKTVNLINFLKKFKCRDNEKILISLIGYPVTDSLDCDYNFTYYYNNSKYKTI